MIKLNQLLKEETFTATNKETGKTSVFKTKDSRDAAIKAGTHDAIKDKEQPSAPKVAGSDLFGGDYAKDRGGETPKADAGKKETPKYNLGVDSVVYNKRTNTIGIVRMGDERGETKTDADGNVNTDELEPYNPMKYPHQKDAKVAPSTSKEIETRSLWKPFSQTSQSTNNSTEKADNVIKGLKPDEYGKHPDSMESGGSLYRINKKGQKVRDREVRLKDITPDDISNTEKLFGVDLSKGIENGLDYKTNSLIIQYKRLQQFDKGGEFENKEAYDSLLNNVKSYSAKEYKKEIDKAEKKKVSSGKNASKYDDPSYWKDEKKYYDGEDDVEKTSDRLDKVEKALENDLDLRGNGFETTRESGGGQGGWEGPMTIIDKDADYDNGYNCLSIGSGENDGKFSIGFYNQDGEPVFDDEDYGSLTGDKVLSANQAYKIGKTLMAMPEVQKFIKGEMTSDEFEAIHDKIKSKFNKSANEGVIRLTKLMENDPCWKGYKQVGMKDKNGREVPNCVPESVVKEAGIPKLFLKIEAVKKKIKALEAERKSKYGGEYARKLNAETDVKKKHELAQPILAITKEIAAQQKNLFNMLDMEERYYANMGKDDELDPNF
jgi:hypothetical protein